jgi:hypothetical protein
LFAIAEQQYDDETLIMLARLVAAQARARHESRLTSFCPQRR